MPLCRIRPPARCPENLSGREGSRFGWLEVVLQARCLRSPVTLCLEGPVVLL